MSEAGEVHTEFWQGVPREGDHLEDLYQWEDHIKMDLQEDGWGGMDWIALGSG